MHRIYSGAAALLAFFGIVGPGGAQTWQTTVEVDKMRGTKTSLAVVAAVARALGVDPWRLLLPPAGASAESARATHRALLDAAADVFEQTRDGGRGDRG